MNRADRNNHHENDGDEVATFEDTPSFLELVPDLTMMSPRAQRKIFADMDEKMRNFAQSQRKQKIRLAHNWADKVLKKDQELRDAKKACKKAMDNYKVLLQKVGTSQNSREISPVA